MAALVQTPSAPGTSFRTLGIGAKSCRMWSVARLENGRDRIAAKQWLMGFLTGLAFVQEGMGQTPSVRDSDDPEDAAAVVDDYCSAHPLDLVSEGAQDLFVKLDKRITR